MFFRDHDYGDRTRQICFRSSFRRENRNLLIAQATGQGAERHKFLASLREEGRLAARNQEEYKSDECERF